MAVFTTSNNAWVDNLGSGMFIVNTPVDETTVSLTTVPADADSFVVGSYVDVPGWPASTFVYQGYGTDGVYLSNASTGEYIYFANTFLAGGDMLFDFVNDDFTPCFLVGTRIATPEGPRAVEDLAIGDAILTITGETRPVKWIGRKTVVSIFADPLLSYPICIAAGALGENVPTRDLFVSPDHALLIDGALVQAGALINGTTIARVEHPEERFTYFHIELDDHSLILAEGVPAETFVDNVTRRRFDNYAEFEALYGTDNKVIPEIDLPRVKSARQLPSTLRARLEAQATATLAA
ncbi:hypothetical protein J2X65_004509 [Ancylobacter sp. 3268]|uniref:Hint domain-containing protein n=1 Tax=Ancylobacter sp. 3268 TaxID=2817752 RepID=UPI00285722BF|nr:Hint domain-containing protein [Ancylobacter sp. 3268]MDR6955130.1 hypothetical protein [Ancylobacter sp. 3268]